MGEHRGSSAVELETRHVQIISVFLPLRNMKPLGTPCLPTPQPLWMLPLSDPASGLLC